MEQFDVSKALTKELQTGLNLSGVSVDMSPQNVLTNAARAITSSNMTNQVTLEAARQLSVEKAQLSDTLQAMSSDATYDKAEHSVEVNMEVAKKNDSILAALGNLNDERAQTAIELSEVMQNRGGLLQNPLKYIAASVRAGRLEDKLAAQSDLLVQLNGTMEQNRSMGNARIQAFESTVGLQRAAVIQKVAQEGVVGMQERQANIQAAQTAAGLNRQTAKDLAPIAVEKAQEAHRSWTRQKDNDLLNSPEVKFYLDLQRQFKHSGEYSDGEKRGALMELQSLPEEHKTGLWQLYGHYLRDGKVNGTATYSDVAKLGIRTNNPIAMTMFTKIGGDPEGEQLLVFGENKVIPQLAIDAKRQVLISKIPENAPDRDARVQAIMSADEKTLSTNPMFKLDANDNKIVQERVKTQRASMNVADLLNPAKAALEDVMTLSADGQDYNQGMVGSLNEDNLTNQVGMSPQSAKLFASPGMKDVMLAAPSTPTVGLVEKTSAMMNYGISQGMKPAQLARDIALLNSKVAYGKGAYRNPQYVAKMEQYGISLSPRARVKAPKLGTGLLDGSRITTDDGVELDATTAEGVFNIWNRYNAVRSERDKAEAAAGKSLQFRTGGVYTPQTGR